MKIISPFELFKMSKPDDFRDLHRKKIRLRLNEMMNKGWINEKRQIKKYEILVEIGNSKNFVQSWTKIPTFKVYLII